MNLVHLILKRKGLGQVVFDARECHTQSSWNAVLEDT